jgi:hypothetical protein
MIEHVKAWLTWGRIAFAVFIAVAGFATFVAGQVAGANSLEPRVKALEGRITAHEATAARLGHDLAEIKGYVRGIAGRLGVGKREVEHE